MYQQSVASSGKKPSLNYLKGITAQTNQYPQDRRNQLEQASVLFVCLYYIVLLILLEGLTIRERQYTKSSSLANHRTYLRLKKESSSVC